MWQWLKRLFSEPEPVVLTTMERFKNGEYKETWPDIEALSGQLKLSSFNHLDHMSLMGVKLTTRVATIDTLILVTSAYALLLNDKASTLNLGYASYQPQRVISFDSFLVTNHGYAVTPDQACVRLAAAVDSLVAAVSYKQRDHKDALQYGTMAHRLDLLKQHLFPVMSTLIKLSDQYHQP